MMQTEVFASAEQGGKTDGGRFATCIALHLYPYCIQLQTRLSVNQHTRGLVRGRAFFHMIDRQGLHQSLAALQLEAQFSQAIIETL